jgi:hypothetical protein
MLERTIACYVTLGAALVVGATAVVASPGSPTVVATIMARAGFASPVDIKLKVGDTPEVLHVPAARDTVMQRIVFQPGNVTGWHSHPGPAIALITRGELWLYDGDDPSCTPEKFGVGQAFVDSGQGHIHMARSSPSQAETEVWVTYLDVPPGSGPRADVADPGFCPPF